MLIINGFLFIIFNFNAVYFLLLKVKIVLDLNEGLHKSKIYKFPISSSI